MTGFKAREIAMNRAESLQYSLEKRPQKTRLESRLTHLNNIKPVARMTLSYSDLPLDTDDQTLALI